MGNSLYTDGSAPQEHYTPLDDKGFAYYSCSSSGPCVKCHQETTFWFVSIKEKGHYRCENCYYV